MTGVQTHQVYIRCINQLTRCYKVFFQVYKRIRCTFRCINKLTRCTQGQVLFHHTPLKELEARQCTDIEEARPTLVVSWTPDIISIVCLSVCQWFDITMELCPYCNVRIDKEKKEHLQIHKTLKHKVLPVRFQSTSLATSAIPLIQDFFRPWDSSTKLLTFQYNPLPKDSKWDLQKRAKGFYALSATAIWNWWRKKTKLSILVFTRHWLTKFYQLRSKMSPLPTQLCLSYCSITLVQPRKKSESD